MNNGILAALSNFGRVPNLVPNLGFDGIRNYKFQKINRVLQEAKFLVLISPVPENGTSVSVKPTPAKP